MIKKEIKLKAYFRNYDAVTKKLTMLFLDDVTEPFTRSFLTQYYNAAQNNPVESQQFYVKFSQYSMCYADKAKQARVPLQDLLQHVVSITIYIKHYNFMSAGKKIQGWNINLLNINLI